LHNQQGPSLPPKPRRLLNPEDSFAFEIIDTDEIRPVQTMNMSVLSFSSQNPQKPQAVSCTKLKETGRCEAHQLHADNAISKNNNIEALSQAIIVSSLKSRSGLKSSAAGEGGLVEASITCNSDELKGTDAPKCVSNNYDKRPMKLTVKDTSCDGSFNMEATEDFPIISAPLATPEQDSSLVDSSSMENLLDEDDDDVLLTTDNEGAVGETYTCPFQEKSSNLQQDVVPPCSATTNESSKCQSCTHSWPVNDLQVLCSGKQNIESKTHVSSSHQTDQSGSSDVSMGGEVTDTCSFGSASHDVTLKLFESVSDISVTTKPSKVLHAPQLGSDSAVGFQDDVCEMPVIQTDIPDGENQTEGAVNSASVPSDSEVNNTDALSLLSVPNASLLSLSPVSTNSSSDCGTALSAATECSTSSGSDTNTMVLSNCSLSTDSVGAGVSMTTNVDVSNSESGEREFGIISEDLSSQLGDEAVSSCIAIVDVDEKNAAEDSAEFVDARAEVAVSLNSPSLRTHKPLSRQVSHPPVASLGQRPEPSAAHFCIAAGLPVQRRIGDETSATAARPHNR
jgi:hypothetical protein